MKYLFHNRSEITGKALKEAFDLLICMVNGAESDRDAKAKTPKRILEMPNALL